MAELHPDQAAELQEQAQLIAVAEDHIRQQLGWLDDAAIHFADNPDDGGARGLRYLSAQLYALSAQLEQHFNPPNYPLVPWRHPERTVAFLDQQAAQE